jgi:nucleoside-diphosphate-sugar epimerase
MKSLVSGASGFLGSALVTQLATAYGPDAVIGLVPDPLPQSEKQRFDELAARGVQLVPCELMQHPVVANAELPFDVLFHLAAATDSTASPEQLAVNTTGTRNLLETFGERLEGRRVVLASTVAAVDRAVRPQELLSESSPIAPRTAYGRSKLEAEQIVAEYGERFDFAWAVPRFCPIWTAELRTGFLGAFRDQVSQRSLLRSVAWPGRVSIVHRQDAVQILQFLAESGAANGTAVHVSDGEVHCYADILADLQRLAGQKEGCWPVPKFLWKGMQRFIWLSLIRGFVPWRLSCLLGDDLAIDASYLRSLYTHPMRTWSEARAEIRF